MCKSRLSTRQRVFRWLRNGRTQSWIVNNKGVNSGLVSRYAREFVEAGLFSVRQLGGNVLEYVPTQRGKGIRIDELSLDFLRSLSRGGNCAGLLSDGVWATHVNFKMRVLDRIGKPVGFWDKKVTGMRGVVQYYKRVDWGTVMYQPGRRGNGGFIRVWLRASWWSGSDELSLEKHVKALELIGDHNARSLLRCNLGIPQYCGRSVPEYVVPSGDVDLSRYNGGRNIRVGDCWIDTSIPLGYETSDQGKALDMLHMVREGVVDPGVVLEYGDLRIPSRVVLLEKAVGEGVSNRMELEERLSSLESNLNVFGGELQSLLVSCRGNEDSIGRLTRIVGAFATRVLKVENQVNALSHSGNGSGTGWT